MQTNSSFSDRVKNNVLVITLLIGIGFYNYYFLFQGPHLVSALGLLIHVSLNTFIGFLIFMLWSLEKFPKFTRSSIFDLSIIAFLTAILLLAIKSYPLYQSTTRVVLTLLLALALCLLVFDFFTKFKTSKLSQ